jgi:hypothetical protein
VERTEAIVPSAAATHAMTRKSSIHWSQTKLFLRSPAAQSRTEENISARIEGRGELTQQAIPRSASRKLTEFAELKAKAHLNKHLAETFSKAGDKSTGKKGCGSRPDPYR